MPSRKRSQSNSVTGDAIAAVKSSIPAKVRKSSLPAWVRFPLMVLLRLTLSALFYTISSQFTAGDLATVSRSINDWASMSGLFVAKVLELAAGWYTGLDGTCHVHEFAQCIRAACVENIFGSRLLILYRRRPCIANIRLAPPRQLSPHELLRHPTHHHTI